MRHWYGLSNETPVAEGVTYTLLPSHRNFFGQPGARVEALLLLAQRVWLFFHLNLGERQCSCTLLDLLHLAQSPIVRV